MSSAVNQMRFSPYRTVSIPDPFEYFQGNTKSIFRVSQNGSGDYKIVTTRFDLILREQSGTTEYKWRYNSLIETVIMMLDNQPDTLKPTTLDKAIKNFNKLVASLNSKGTTVEWTKEQVTITPS